MFDDSLLDDPGTLSRRGQRLEQLARFGSRLRYEHADEVAAAVAGLTATRPRSVVVIGHEARLVRAVVEPTSPIPVVAWPTTTLPAWAGPLDLVIVLAESDCSLLPCCVEASRRGSLLLLVAPQGSPILDQFGSGAILVTREADPLVSALLACKVLDILRLGPALDLDTVANVVDEAADECGPRHGLGVNPAKDLACALADTIPLVWGGSVLAARASRRVAEALRQVTRVPALAADDRALVPLIEGARPRDLFADPFEDPSGSISFSVLVLDDGDYPLQAVDLADLAASRNIRVETIRHTAGGPVARYVGLLHRGLFAVAYIELADNDKELR